MLTGVCIFPIADISLHNYGKPHATNLGLLVLTIPAAGTAQLTLLEIILQPRWN